MTRKGSCVFLSFMVSLLKGFPFGGSCRPQAADEGGVRVASLLTGNLCRLSPHPSAGGAADTFSPKGRRLLSALKASPEGLPPVPKGFPLGGSCRPQAADEGGVRVVSLLTGNTRRLSPHPSAGGAADTFSPMGRRLLPALKASPEGLPPALKASPEGLRPQARVGAQPPKAALSA